MRAGHVTLLAGGESGRNFGIKRLLSLNKDIPERNGSPRRHDACGKVIRRKTIWGKIQERR